MNSYRTHRYDFQLQLSKKVKPARASPYGGAPAKYDTSLSTMTLGSMVGSVDPKQAISQFKREKERAAMVSISGEGTLVQRREDQGEYTHRSHLNQMSESNHDVLSHRHKLIMIQNME